MNREIVLPAAGRQLIRHTLGDPPKWPEPDGALIQSRVAFAAAHVVADPLADDGNAIDWDATLAYRRVLWAHGFAVAEAMDTAQRGTDLGWSAARELIQRSCAEAKSDRGRRIACGAGTDQLTPGFINNLDTIIAAYTEQCEWVERSGAQIILMASRALAACARGSGEYEHVYGTILSQTMQPVILHWLGPMFDPALTGYWGAENIDDAMDSCLKIISENTAKVDGIKVSLLDPKYELEMRRRLPAGVRLYTGDDFHFDELILGDEQGHSDALLGIFDAIAPAASAALHALDRNDVAEYHRILAPTVPLSRTIFEAPTYSYKTGIVFLAWLNGYQKHFRMLGGRESARTITHLARVFMQADAAGLLIDPDLACQRMRHVLAQAGVTA